MSTMTMTRSTRTTPVTPVVADAQQHRPATHASPAVRTAPVARRTAPVARRATAARPASGVQLTRRGRWVVTLLILGAILGLSLVVSSGSVATGERGAPATEQVVVEQGDTLWGIATRVGGPGETQSVMLEIEQLNHLDSSVLVEGQVLAVPAP